MKVFLEFSSIFPKQIVEVNKKVYQINELNKLNGYKIDVHKYFNIKEDIITKGKFVWNNETKHLYLHMWLIPEDVNYFEKQIMSGQLVPMNIKLTPDSVEDEDIKNYNFIMSEEEKQVYG